MGKENENDITKDEIVMLAYALEYNYSNDINGALDRILEKIEKGLHVDTYVGNRLSEYGRIMGWEEQQ